MPVIPVAPPLDYTIQGDNLQIARIRLKAGQELYAEAGKMVYKTPNITWESRMSGESIGDKIWGPVKGKFRASPSSGPTSTRSPMARPVSPEAIPGRSRSSN
jgi:hypothetical protein